MSAVSGGASAPPSPCLVVGNAFSMHEDLALARGVFPDAPAIAVNGAARFVKAMVLYSQHPEIFKVRGWIERQRKFGDDFAVHSTYRDEIPDMPWVDRWWPRLHGGSSAWGARKVAGLLGYSPVILVGCPLDTGNYVEALGQLMTRPKVIQDLRDFMAADTDWHEGAYSVSGWTRGLLGGLDALVS